MNSRYWIIKSMCGLSLYIAILHKLNGEGYLRGHFSPISSSSPISCGRFLKLEGVIWLDPEGGSFLLLYLSFPPRLRRCPEKAWRLCYLDWGSGSGSLINGCTVPELTVLVHWLYGVCIVLMFLTLYGYFYLSFLGIVFSFRKLPRITYVRWQLSKSNQ